MTKAVVTGGAGFIGSYLIDALLSQGGSVVCIDNLSTGSMKNIAPFFQNPRFQFIRSDVEKLSSLENHIADSDVIFHLAASVGVKNIVDHPIHCIENNLFCTSQILQLAAKYSRRTITFSTSEVYGKSKKFPFEEEDDLVLGSSTKLRWAYAASKLMDDYLARAYFVEKKLPVTVVRLFNTIGQRQVGHYGMVVPRFFQSALAGQPLTVFGSGQQTRCFTDVRDVVAALLAIFPEERTYGELVNIGNNQEMSILALADKIIDLTSSSSTKRMVPYQEFYGENFEDMERRVPSSQKLLELTGFRFRYSFNETLNWIYQGFQAELSSARLVSSSEVNI